MTTFEELKKLAKKFPNSPGVYTWRNKKGEPIYIGRAGSLKKRVGSYFLHSAPPEAGREAKTAEMVRTAAKLGYQKTDTLLEAVILEANLIKKYWPKYNVEEKDDKSFIYLVVTNDEFPKPIIIRGRELEKYVPTVIAIRQLAEKQSMNSGSPRPNRPRDDKKMTGSQIFGPYQSYRILRTVLELLRPIFPYSTCTAPKTSFAGSGKPCFHYQIGLCPGVCIGKADKKEYRKNIRNLILFLRGDKKRLLSRLKKENPEKAQALQHVNDVALLAESDALLRVKGQLSNVSRIEGYDISHLSGKEPVGAMVVFVGGAPDKSQYRLFKIRGAARGSTQTDTRINAKGNFATHYGLPAYRTGRRTTYSSADDLAMLREVLERRLKHSEWPLPDVVFVDGGLLQVKTARDVLDQHKIFVPVIGLSKGGKHAASAYATDKLVALNVKKVGKELLLSSKRLFQEVRNEAHRFSISFQRKRIRKRSLTWRHQL